MGFVSWTIGCWAVGVPEAGYRHDGCPSERKRIPTNDDARGFGTRDVLVDVSGTGSCVGRSTGPASSLCE